MRKVFAALATLLTLAVVAQFFLAASGAFDTAPNEESFQPHRMLGYGIVLFAVLMTVVAAISRMPGRVIGMTGLIAGLVLLQGVIRAIASAFGDTGESTTTGQFIFGLHAINALVIMALAGTIARRAREVSRSAATNQMTRAGASQAAPTS
jgi:heme A synthase